MPPFTVFGKNIQAIQRPSKEPQINMSIIGLPVKEPKERIDFYLDTGSPYTIISLADAKKIRLDIPGIISPPFSIPVTGVAGGIISLYPIKPVNLILYGKEGTVMVIDKTNAIYFPKFEKFDTTESVLMRKSLLGRDVLYQVSAYLHRQAGDLLLYFKIF